jgi:hypothetical protein
VPSDQVSEDVQAIRNRTPGKGPARGYSWRAFEGGNKVAQRHGGYSERSVAERAEAVRRDLYATAPWLAEQPSWAVAVERFLRVEARARIFAEYVEALAAERGAAAVPIRAAEVANASDRLASDLGATLGLDVASFAKLRQLGAAVSRDEAVTTLTDLRTSGAAIRAQAEARMAADVLDEQLATETKGA